MNSSGKIQTWEVITGGVIAVCALIFIVFWGIFGDKYRAHGTRSAECMFWTLFSLGLVIFFIGIMMFCMGLYHYHLRVIFGMGVAFVCVGLIVVVFTLTKWKGWKSEDISLYNGILYGLGVGCIGVGAILLLISLLSLTKK